MSGPWADWDRPLAPLFIDATEYPRMRDATADARRWLEETGCDECSPGRPRKVRQRLCDDHEGHDEAYAFVGELCMVERTVWRFDPVHRCES